jgi:hypothetical protein
MWFGTDDFDDFDDDGKTYPPFLCSAGLHPLTSDADANFQAAEGLCPTCFAEAEAHCYEEDAEADEPTFPMPLVGNTHGFSDEEPF